MSLPRRLRLTVYVADDAGDVHGFGPGQEVPDWAAAQIVNPDAWADAPADGGGSPEVPIPPAPAVPADPPPKAGRGSSAAAWRAYAAGRVDVTEGMGRDDIIAALDAAGIRTE